MYEDIAEYIIDFETFLVNVHEIDLQQVDARIRPILYLLWHIWKLPRDGKIDDGSVLEGDFVLCKELDSD